MFHSLLPSGKKTQQQNTWNLLNFFFTCDQQSQGVGGGGAFYAIHFYRKQNNIVLLVFRPLHPYPKHPGVVHIPVYRIANGGCGGNTLVKIRERSLVYRMQETR
jgi:hypothetical protein